MSLYSYHPQESGKYSDESSSGSTQILFFLLLLKKKTLIDVISASKRWVDLLPMRPNKIIKCKNLNLFWPNRILTMWARPNWSSTIYPRVCQTLSFMIYSLDAGRSVCHSTLVRLQKNHQIYVSRWYPVK